MESFLVIFLVIVVISILAFALKMYLNPNEEKPKVKQRLPKYFILEDSGAFFVVNRRVVDDYGNPVKVSEPYADRGSAQIGMEMIMLAAEEH